MSRRPTARGNRRGALGGGFFPPSAIAGCVAFWDATRGLVLSGANVTTAADQAPGGTADTATGASGLEPQFVASDGGGPCFDFATGRYFSLTHSADFDFGAAFTVTGWIKRVSAGGNHHIFTQSLGATERLRMGPLSDNNFYALSDGTAGNVNCGYGTGLGWRHFAVTYDGGLAASSRLAIYLDGTAQAVTVSAAFPATMSAVNKDRIGLLAFNDSNPFNSKMAWLGIWNRALTAAEVVAAKNYQPRA